MMYFMAQNKMKEAIRKKDREEKTKFCDIKMSSPSFVGAILNEQHQREKDAKSKQRAQPAENAKFDMARSLFGSAAEVEVEESTAEASQS